MDFMCLTMIDATTGWFEIVELPNRMIEKKCPRTGKTSEVEIIDKTSATVSHLLNRQVLVKSLSTPKVPGV